MKTPNNIHSPAVCRQVTERHDPLEVSFDHFVVINETFFFESLVEQIHLLKQIQIDFAEFESVAGLWRLPSLGAVGVAGVESGAGVVCAGA